MAGRSDIEAGRAHVSLYVNSSALAKGLQAAAQRMQSFGTGIAKMGGAMMAGSAAVLAPMVGMVKGFSDAGSAIADMSARTGVSVETLSVLGYAAGMTGASIEDVEKGIRKMQQNGMGADKIGKVADKLAAMTDPAKRTAYAMQVFGKSGAALIPMLSGGAAGLAKFRSEADRLGVVMSSDDAAAADALGDAMDNVTVTVKGAAMQIGAALAPAVTWLAESMVDVTSGILAFVRDNREIVVAVAGAIVGVAGLGAATVALGGTIAAAGMALSGIVGLFGAVLSPIGLVVGGIAAATAAFVTFTDTGRWLADSLMADFGAAWDSVKEMVGGISDALAAGEIALAANIAMVGLKAAFFEATNTIRTVWIDFNKRLVEGVANAAKAVVGVWRRASQSLAEMFADLGYKVSLFMSGQKDYLTDDERIGARDSALNEYYDGLQGSMEGGIDSLSAGMNESLDSQLTAGEARIQALKDELAALRGTAAEKVEAVRVARKGAPEAAKVEGFSSGAGLGSGGGAAASFSASALASLGQGGGPMDKLVKVNEDQKKIAEASRKSLDEINASQRKMAALLTIA